MDAAKIARGLTEAQKRAINPPAHGPFATSICSLTSVNTQCALRRKGLVVDRMYATALTEIGLAVRAHLQGEAQ